ncbi:hypothetical protein G9C85_01920 [Halorubellus sp. JP-L1]|uniref:hypothetical protein n=1 Tax=Halorubellus sp. JP-L1 TaxID=2715753 RepID=UPI00140D1DFC|nr:hypothetical protein [Halorubellus sp. JP-L1]NHN40394.1 hypothetical protein [Halorubellus sp. JP-L1]
MTIYVGSNGRRYTPSEVVENLEEGPWRSCLWRTDTDQELVDTGDGELLMLVPEDRLTTSIPEPRVDAD